MAGGDYRRCDKCGGKAFYDVRLNYEWCKEPPADFVSYRENGVENTGVCLDYLGAWAVLCTDCAKTHDAIVVPRADGLSCSARRRGM